MAPQHNISQMRAFSNTAKETVEIGTHVDPGIYGNNNPHLFIFSTTNGYTLQPPGVDGCYNNVGSGCVSYTTVPGANFAPGMTLPASAIGSPSEVTLVVLRDSNGWGLAAASGNSLAYTFGRYLASAFSSIAGGADIMQLGGEVFEPTAGFIVPMGFGSVSLVGYPGASYQREFWAYSTGNDPCNALSGQPCWSAVALDQPNYYFGNMLNQSTKPAGWTNAWFFGSPDVVVGAG